MKQFQNIQRSLATLSEHHFLRSLRAHVVNVLPHIWLCTLATNATEHSKRLSELRVMTTVESILQHQSQACMAPFWR